RPAVMIRGHDRAGRRSGQRVAFDLGDKSGARNEIPAPPTRTGQSAMAWCKFGVDDVESEMTQPAKVQEPSMEEILASIRRIIADDEAKPAGDKASGPAAAARPAMKDIPPSIPAAAAAKPPSRPAPPPPPPAP